MNDDNDISKIDKQIQDILNTEKTVYDDNHQVIVDRKYAYDDDLHGDTKKINTLSDLQVEEYNDQEDIGVEEDAIDIVKNEENINNSEMIVDENDNNYLFIILTVICCLILVFIFIILFFS